MKRGSKPRRKPLGEMLRDAESYAPGIRARLPHRRMGGRRCGRVTSAATPGEVNHARVRSHGREPSPLPEVPVREPAARVPGPRRAAADGPLAAEPAARPDHVGVDADGGAHRLAARRDQRVRLRAGGAEEHSARALRLHGLRHRRRGDAAREPRGLPQVPAPAAPPRRREQGRHEHPDPRRSLRHADRHRAGRRPEGVPRRGRDRGRASGEAGESPDDPLDRDDQSGGRGDPGARRADLVPALREQQVGRSQGRSSCARRRRAASRSPSRSTATAAATRRRCSASSAPTIATARAATIAAACRRTRSAGRCTRASISPG